MFDIVYFVTPSRSPERSEGASEGFRFFAEPVLSGGRFFATLRMTESMGGLKMTESEEVRMTGSEGLE